MCEVGFFSSTCLTNMNAAAIFFNKDKSVDEVLSII